MKIVVVYVISGPLKGHKYIVKSNSKILIGRSKEATIRIEDDGYCSRRHASVYWEDESVYVEDLGSTNGTLLNSAPIEGKTKLSKGDIIGLGETELIISVQNLVENIKKQKNVSDNETTTSEQNEIKRNLDDIDMKFEN